MYTREGSLPQFVENPEIFKKEYRFGRSLIDQKESRAFIYLFPQLHEPHDPSKDKKFHRPEPIAKRGASPSHGHEYVKLLRL